MARFNPFLLLRDIALLYPSLHCSNVFDVTLLSKGIVGGIVETRETIKLDTGKGRCWHWVL